MWPFHQTKSTPPIDATNAAKRERDRAVERDVVAERRHPHRVVAHALQRQPERRPHEVAEQRVDGDRGPERDVVEPVGVRVDAADTPGVGMPLMPPKPETVVTWPKNRFAITE